MFKQDIEKLGNVLIENLTVPDEEKVVAKAAVGLLINALVDLNQIAFVLTEMLDIYRNRN
jgi:hypothetical protein